MSILTVLYTVSIAEDTDHMLSEHGHIAGGSPKYFQTSNFRSLGKDRSWSKRSFLSLVTYYTHPRKRVRVDDVGCAKGWCLVSVPWITSNQAKWAAM
jgi:hypothetical protein